MRRRNFLSQAAAGTVLSGVVLGGSDVARQLVAADEPVKKIKIGQIGTAHAHASGKIATARKFKDLYEFVGVVEPDAKRRAAVSSQAAYRGVRWLSQQQLLAEPGLEVVNVETAVEQLIPTARQCIDAGLHIHLDKPAGADYQAFAELMAAAQRGQRIVQMGYMLRYNPGLAFTFQAVRQGWLGDIFEVHTVMSKTVGQSTRDELARFAGGSMFELGCHIIDALVALMGPPTSVTPYLRRTRSSTGDTLADNTLAVFEYPRATATVRRALMEVDGGRRRQFVVCGTRGTIAIKPLEPPRLELTLDQARGKFRRGTQTVALKQLGGRYDGDFLDLAKVVRGQKKNDYPPAHDLAVHKSLLQASGMLK